MKPYSHVWIADDQRQRFFGPGPYELLTRVERTGSLLGASKEMGMAYTKACRLIAHAEEGLGESILDRHAGGARGGGSHLTSEGKDVLDRYDSWTKASAHAVDDYFTTCFAGMDGVPRLGCVVMASGAAQRFGRQKLLEPLDGVPVLERTVSAALASCFDVVVASRWPEVRELARKFGAEVAQPAGPSQSDTVKAGVAALGPRAGYLFMQGDQPLVATATLNAMAHALALDPMHVVRLSWQGKAASPVLFPGRFRAALEALEGDVGGGAILRSRPDEAASAQLVEATSELELADVDTPEELARVQEQLRAASDAAQKGESN